MLGNEMHTVGTVTGSYEQGEGGVLGTETHTVGTVTGPQPPEYQRVAGWLVQEPHLMRSYVGRRDVHRVKVVLFYACGMQGAGERAPG